LRTEKTGPHKDELDLKRAVLVHLVDCIRLYALREGLAVTSTFERLKELVALHVFPEEDADSFRVAYEGVLMLRLRQNLERQSQGLEPTNHIDPRRLSRREQNAVRDALLTASRLQHLVGMSFRVN
jgi:CBS domain-containing protein